MTTSAISYRRKKLGNLRRITPRKTAKTKRDLTHVFNFCLKCTILGLCVVFISLSSIILYKEILKSAYFHVKKIQVEGCLRHTKDQILYIAGIKSQTNLFSLNLKNICQCLENSPWIERAKVKRIFPDKLDISIIERKPAALINLKQLYLIDKKGTIFKKAEREDGLLAFPILTGVTWQDLMKPQGTHTHLITQTLTLMAILEEEGIDISAISEIHLDPTFGLTVFTTHHATQIDMGFPPFQEKCRHLCSIMEDLKRKDLIPQTIDLNYSCRAFVKAKPQNKEFKSIKKGGEKQWVKMEI